MPNRRSRVRVPRAFTLVASAAVLALAGTAAAHEERDLVCGMMVDVDDAEFVATHDGRNYYFCNEADLAIFRADPDAYAGALKLSREGSVSGATYECSIRPRVPEAGGDVTFVLTTPPDTRAGAATADVYFVDRETAPVPARRIRLSPLPLEDEVKLGMKLLLPSEGDVRVLVRIPLEAGGEDVVVFSIPVAPAVADPHGDAIASALASGTVSMEAQHASMAEIGDLWTAVAKRLESEPPDLEGSKEPLARIRALSRLMGGFELHHFPEAKDEMLAEAAVFESGVVSLLRSVSRDKIAESRERYAVIDAMSCTKCHYKFRFGVIDDISRFPDLRTPIDESDAAPSDRSQR